MIILNSLQLVDRIIVGVFLKAFIISPNSFCSIKIEITKKYLHVLILKALSF